MAKRDNPKKRDDLRNLYGNKALTVGELIALLKTFPEDLPVTGYNGQEETDLVSCSGVRLTHTDISRAALYPNSAYADRYVGPHVDIMGF